MASSATNKDERKENRKMRISYIENFHPFALFGLLYDKLETNIKVCSSPKWKNAKLLLAKIQIHM